MKNNFDTDYQWVHKVVNSSVSHEQLDCSRNCFTNFLNKYKSHLDNNPSVYRGLSDNFNEAYYKKFLELR